MLGGIFMDIHSLQCFLSLAQYLNYTKTAEKEHLTQPSLSRKINNLEAELGVRLFNRDSHQVSLTEAGKEFYYDTQKYMESFSSAVTKAQNIQNGFHISLKIGIGLYEHNLLSLFLPHFARKHPKIDFSCYQYPYLELIHKFEQGILDVIFTSDKYFSDFDFQSVRTHLICDTPWVLAVGSSDPLSEYPSIPYGSLEGKTLVTMSEGPTSYFLETYRKRQLGSLKKVIFVNTNHTKMLMIDSGLAVAVIPEFVNTSEYPNIQKKEFDFLFRPRSFYLLYRENHENPHIRTFASEYLTFHEKKPE